MTITVAVPLVATCVVKLEYPDVLVY